MTTTTPLHTPQDAAFTEQVLSEWRDWRAYLAAQQTLLQARRAEQDDPFETSAADVQEQTAQHTVNRLPPARRSLFQQEHERRRQQVARDLDAERRLNGLRGAADPDEVDAQTLTVLLAECEGRSTEDGRGLVPREDDTYWGLEVGDLLEAPAAGAYALKGTVTAQQKLLLGGGMLALVLGVVVVLWLLLGSGGTAPATAAEGLLVNGVQQTPLALRALQVRGPDDAEQALPLTPVPAPTPFPADAPAAVRADAVYPPLLCLDAATLAEAQQVTLIGAGQQPQRTYTLRPPGNTSGADLLLQPCDGDGPVRAGVLQAVIPPPEQRVGDTVTLTLPDGSTAQVTVQALDLVGPGHDRTLPADGARVRVTVQADAPVDWPTLKPTLLLHTGAALLPAATEPQAAGGVQFRFLITAPTAPLDAALLLTSGDHVVRWRARLAPPPSRVAVLRQGLRVSDIQAQPGPLTSGTVPLTISLTIQNGLDLPLTLAPAEVTLTQADTPLPLPDLPDLREPLAAGADRTLTLPVTAASTADDPLVLTIGAQRYQITVAPAP
jgi:hypothetical protein